MYQDRRAAFTFTCTRVYDTRIRGARGCPAKTSAKTNAETTKTAKTSATAKTAKTSPNLNGANGGANGGSANGRVSRGGESAWTQRTLAYETVGCLTEFGLDDPQQYILSSAVSAVM